MINVGKLDYRLLAHTSESHRGIQEMPRGIRLPLTKSLITIGACLSSAYFCSYAPTDGTVILGPFFFSLARADLETTTAGAVSEAALGAKFEITEVNLGVNARTKQGLQCSRGSVMAGQCDSVQSKPYSEAIKTRTARLIRTLPTVKSVA
jgi:hypothetical protein